MLKRRTDGQADRRTGGLVGTVLSGSADQPTDRPADRPITRPSALLPVYAQFPVRPVRGRGSWLIDENGDEWLDAYGGHAVAATGHSHPDVVRAIADQA